MWLRRQSAVTTARATRARMPLRSLVAAQSSNAETKGMVILRPTPRDALRSSPKDASMMAFWHRIKQAHPSSIIFFRNGDFYEIFHDDVEPACELLNIREAKRTSASKVDVRMAGVPVRSAAPYLGKLARHNRTIVLVEQDTDAASAGAKLIPRRVARIVTPGTLTDDEMLDAQSSNTLMVISGAAQWTPNAHCGVAHTDVSTGAPVTVASTSVAGLRDLCSAVAPREVVLPLVSRVPLRASSLQRAWTARSAVD